jgi:UDP-N-acetylglucosamine acyltransferase
VADHAVIGAGCRILSHATVNAGTRLGEACVVHPGAVIGGDPQDKKFDGGPTFLEVGPRTVFREYVTVSRATKAGAATRIGSDCLFMTGAHVGHDCLIGNHVTVANTVNFGGHVEVHDRAVIGGLAGIHQFVRIGTMAMVGGDSGLGQDAPPYMITAGSRPALVFGLNIIGLERNGVSVETRRHLKRAFRCLFRSELSLPQAVEYIKANLPMEHEVAELLKFIAGTTRGLSPGANGKAGEVISVSPAGSAREEAERVLADGAIRAEILKLLQESAAREGAATSA